MYTLFIDTHSEKAIVILFKNNEVISLKESINQSHSSSMTLMINNSLSENNINFKDLGMILVVNGPGSFTGIRIGITIAKTMAYSLNIPIKVLTSLELQAISSSLDKKLATYFDKNGYYIGLFDNDNKLQGEYLYLKENELKDYLTTHKLENNILKNDVDYLKVLEYTKNLKAVNPHEVKPLYVKKIEVEK